MSCTFAIERHTTSLREKECSLWQGERRSHMVPREHVMTAEFSCFECYCNHVAQWSVAG